MSAIFLLCAAFSLSIEVAAAPEKHLNEEWPVQMLDRTGEKEPQPEEEVGEEMAGDVKKSSCPVGWSKYGSRCFVYIHREMAWVDAEKYCVGNGANLASIHNRGEYQFIQDVNYVWLWSDGSAFHFQDWAVSQPDNYQDNEKCVVMNQPADLLWGDVQCEMVRPFFCGTRPL